MCAHAFAAAAADVVAIGGPHSKSVATIGVTRSNKQKPISNSIPILLFASVEHGWAKWRGWMEARWLLCEWYASNDCQMDG